MMLSKSMLLVSIGMFTCIIAALCGREWVTLTTQGYGGKTIARFNNGLWKECVDDVHGSSGVMCMDIENDKRALTKKSIVWLKYVRGLAIGAAVTGGLTIIFTVIGYWQARAIYASTIAALLTGVKTVVCLVIFQRNNHWTDIYNFQYGSSFDLAISAACLAGLSFITGLFSILYAVDKDAKPSSYCRQQVDDEVEIDEVCVRLNKMATHGPTHHV